MSTTTLDRVTLVYGSSSQFVWTSLTFAFRQCFFGQRHIRKQILSAFKILSAHFNSVIYVSLFKLCWKFFDGQFARLKMRSVSKICYYEITQCNPASLKDCRSRPHKQADTVSPCELVMITSNCSWAPTVSRHINIIYLIKASSLSQEVFSLHKISRSNISSASLGHIRGVTAGTQTMALPLRSCASYLQWKRNLKTHNTTTS